MATTAPASAASPLVRVDRGSLQPKIVSLYHRLFRDGAKPPSSDGFWVEFFILRAHTSALCVILSSLSTEDMLHLQPVIQTVFSKAIFFLSDQSPETVANALDTLHILVREVLAKQMTSSDVISLLVGLDKVDKEFQTFVLALESIMRHGETPELRISALRTTLSTVCSAYRTSLVNYFIHRDLFPVLVQLIDDPDTESGTFEAFVLLGLLSNYDRLAAYNPYQTRLADFADESIMQKVVLAIGRACNAATAEYVAIVDDSSDQFGIEKLVALAGFAWKTKSLKQDPARDAKRSLASMPPHYTTILLATSNFVHANKYFARMLVQTKIIAQEESPFGSFISLTSYLLENQHRSERQAIYGRIALLVLRMLVEDPVTMQLMAGIECRTAMRICRQRQPVLVFVRGERFTVEGILDSLICAIDHNMKKALDVRMYALVIGIILRIMSQLKRTRVRLKYHWAELWRCLFAFTRFLASLSPEVRATLPGISGLVDVTIRTLVVAFSSGEAFLHEPEDYDDLFYKLIASGDMFSKIAGAYDPASPGVASGSPTPPSIVGAAAPIDTLISISEYYRNLISQRTGTSNNHSLAPIGTINMSAKDVAEVIKLGYDSLSINAQPGIDNWDRYRESDERVFLKKAGSVAVLDARDVLLAHRNVSLLSVSNAAAVALMPVRRMSVPVEAAEKGKAMNVMNEGDRENSAG
ncbi:uncharacterized protein V1518DRAFT_415561 [Limtongia smithiae]|uniref:uncharacterized protein n=1 Tax=Limtongia smithiae TaxID=1125753 RepID=UPI0034CD5161